MSTHRLKLKLLKEKQKEHQCENCKLKVWLDKPIPLELHHIDGSKSNNEINNLQLLCANCHALTDNYRARKKKKIKKIISDNQIIEAIKSSYTKREALLKCQLSGYGGNYDRINRIINQYNVNFLPHPKSESQTKRIETIRKRYGSVKECCQNKIEWPDKETLIKMLKSKSNSKVSKELGVSNSAVRKHIKRLGVNMKDISPWARKHGGDGRTPTDKDFSEAF